jgi:cellulose synthase operon protein C
VRLADVIGQWLGRVELVVAGADGDLRDGQDALSAGDPIGARAAAHRVLARAPDSPLGLALLSDACDAAHLDAELAFTLEELARRVPSRAEVWVRLGRARSTIQAPTAEVRDAFGRALAVAESGSDARRDSLVALADLDLADGRAARAELWLERMPSDLSAEIVVRRAQARLWGGDASGALALLDSVVVVPTDGRAALVRGRALASIGDSAAFASLVRAVVLDVDGSSEALSDALTHLPSDDETRARVTAVVDAKAEAALARWRAAFASARGEHAAARAALREAVESGETAAALPLVDAGMQDHDSIALKAGLDALPASSEDPLLVDARLLAEAVAHGGREALDAASKVVHARGIEWASAIARDVVRRWVPPAATASAWTEVLARLGEHARAIHDEQAAANLDELSAERARPLRVAVVGEFNAGKSTFINALLGAEVARVGVLPTTATLHRLRWGTIEVVDTPGFNSLDPRHADLARSVLVEIDIALWLLDATQAFKESERVALEEAQRRTLPFVVVVNKSDRLSSDDLRTVMRSLDDALARAGLVPWVAPWAVSAKRALAGKLGDSAALEASGWRTAESFIEESIASRRDELKERALRRHALGVTLRLTAAWTARASLEQEQARVAADWRRATARSAARLEAEEDTLAPEIARSLAPVAAVLEHDMRLVSSGRDAESAARDPALARYRADRAVAEIAPVLVDALVALTPDLPFNGVDASIRGLVRGAFGCIDPATDLPLIRLARAALSTWVEHLVILASMPATRGQGSGVARELHAFVDALAVELPNRQVRALE